MNMLTNLRRLQYSCDEMTAVEICKAFFVQQAIFVFLWSVFFQNQREENKGITRYDD